MAVTVKVRFANKASLLRKTNAYIFTVINKRARALQPLLQIFTHQRLKELIQETDIYQYLADPKSDLTYQLGLVNGKSRIDSIIEQWLGRINVVASIAPMQGVTITVTGFATSYEDLLAMEEASYVSESSGSIIPWLKWLVIESDTIAQHRILYGSFAYGTTYRMKASRTGGAIMVPSKTESWKLSPEYAGSPGDNFFTQSIVRLEPEIRAFVIQRI